MVSCSLNGKAEERKQRLGKRSQALEAERLGQRVYRELCHRNGNTKRALAIYSRFCRPPHLTSVKLIHESIYHLPNDNSFQDPMITHSKTQLGVPKVV